MIATRWAGGEESAAAVVVVGRVEFWGRDDNGGLLRRVDREREGARPP